MILRQHFTNELLGFLSKEADKYRKGDVIALCGRQYLIHRLVAEVEDITPSGGCTGSSSLTLQSEPAPAQQALEQRVADLEQQVKQLREAGPVPPNYWPWL